MSVRLRATRCGVPRTTTSKTFCFSNRLPTWMPDSSVASARRTSPGLMPYRCAFARLDLDRHGRLLGQRSTRGFDDAVHAGQQLLHPRRLLAQRSPRSSP